MIPLLALSRRDRTDILAGLFVAAVLVLLAAWLAVKILGQSLQRNVYYTLVPDVSGLRVGTPVMVAGYRVGLIRGIDYKWPSNPPEQSKAASQEACSWQLQNPGLPPNRTLFRLSLAIDEDWRPREASRVQIERANPLAQPVVALALGEGQTLCPGSVLPLESSQTGQADVDLAELQRNANQVLTSASALLRQLEQARLPETTAQLLADARNAVGSLAQSAATVNRFVNDQDLQAAQAEVRQAASQLTALLQDTRTLVNQARRQTSEITGSVKKIGPPLNHAATDLEYTLRLLSSRLPGVLGNLERTALELADLLAELRANPIVRLGDDSTEKPAWTGKPPP